MDDTTGTSGNYSMKWSEEHDLMLCREVLVMEPFKYPKQSRERGEIWGEIAQNLNGLSSPKFTVRTRSVRDRLTLLLKKYKEKMRNEEQGSGMKCDEETELEMALSDIIEKEQAADLERKENTNTLTKKNETDKASAEESRLKALERLGQTKKRNADSCDEVIKPKSKRSTTEAVQILKEKFENEKEFRKEEMELKKKEQENKAAQHQILIDQQRQNQQQYQDVMKMMGEQQQRQEQQLQNFQMLFLQQQQQQSQMLMSLLEKVMPKSS
ncbi:putative uncharacterized protein DDB_G0274435 [Montipora capricornis]|uniref:putative uncharacterized protein DDB_G0274435 n=1 Tax=Montipora capricornis TaxID=246305 RepID=UPI0035F1618A